MTDTFELTLNSPITEEQWDQITDVDFDRTDRIWFHTKHGKEVEFVKVRHGKWITEECCPGVAVCSNCGHEIRGIGCQYTKYCEECGCKMDEE